MNIPMNKFKDFKSMKNSYSSNKKKNNIVKELDEMKIILSKSVRKPSEKEKIKKEYKLIYFFYTILIF